MTDEIAILRRADVHDISHSIGTHQPQHRDTSATAGTRMMLQLQRKPHLSVQRYAGLAEDVLVTVGRLRD